MMDRTTRTLMCLAAAASLAAPFEAAASDVAVSKITLNDGQSLRGKILDENAGSITLEILSGETMQLPRSLIRSISQEKVQDSAAGEVRSRELNRTRYFYAPSAMMLKKGEGYFSQKELIFSALAYGLTDNVSVLVGTVAPAWFLPNGSGINFIGALRLGISPAEKFHLAAGAETIFLPGSGGAGFIFGSATIGDSNAHLTISGGYPFSFSTSGYSYSSFGDVLFVVAGDLRMTANFALVTEHWIMPYFRTPYPDLYTLDAVGGRIFGDKLAVDLGILFIPRMSGVIPIPWLDFTWSFGT